MLLSAPACVASQSMSRCPAASRSRREARSGRRLAAVAARATAAPGGGGARQAAAPPSSRAAKQQQLVSALLEATRKEVVQGWLADLVLPLVPSADPTADLAPPPPTRPAQALAGPEGRFVRVDGVGLHYREALPGGNGSSGSSSNDSSGSGGSGGASSAVGSDRPAILLVHGFNGSTFSWRAQMQALADATGCRRGAEGDAPSLWVAGDAAAEPMHRRILCCWCHHCPTLAAALVPARRVLAYDRPPFGLAERPLSWGGPGDELAYDPYSLEGQGRMAQVGGRGLSRRRERRPPAAVRLPRQRSMPPAPAGCRGVCSCACRPRGAPDTTCCCCCCCCCRCCCRLCPCCCPCVPPPPQGLLDALGVRSVVAVGHSAGALVCMELALRAPRRVAGARARRWCASCGGGRGCQATGGLHGLVRSGACPPRRTAGEALLRSAPFRPLRLRPPAGLGFVAPALPTTPERSFQRRAGLGQQLRFLAVRGAGRREAGRVSGFGRVAQLRGCARPNGHTRAKPPLRDPPC